MLDTNKKVLILHFIRYYYISFQRIIIKIKFEFSVCITYTFISKKWNEHN